VSVGDSNDIFSRLKGMLPTRWFGTSSDSVPLIDAILTGLSANLAFIYSLYAYAKLQTRINTATDGWLDLIAADFFGTSLTRKVGQNDSSFRNAIKAQLLREKATRNAIVLALVGLTGRAPTIVEPRRPADTGAYGVSTSGYGSAGYYCSNLLPYQAFVIAFRPRSADGIANVAGYGISTGGYNTSSQAEYASISAFNGGVNDSDIFAAVDAVKPEGTIVWMTIKS
jgi:hypothetical protein